MMDRGELSYFICCSPRTGSFLLAEALESTQIAGRPREYFDWKHEKDWIDRFNIAANTEYFEKILSEGTTPNGVFGAKVHWYQFVHLTSKLRMIQAYGLSERELLRHTFPDLRYVFLTRRDKVRQAVSYYRATHTDVWWSFQPKAYRNSSELRAIRRIKRLDQYLALVSNMKRAGAATSRSRGAGTLRGSVRGFRTSL